MLCRVVNKQDLDDLMRDIDFDQNPYQPSNQQHSNNSNHSTNPTSAATNTNGLIQTSPLTTNTNSNSNSNNNNKSFSIVQPRLSVNKKFFYPNSPNAAASTVSSPVGPVNSTPNRRLLGLLSFRALPFLYFILSSVLSLLRNFFLLFIFINVLFSLQVFALKHLLSSTSTAECQVLTTIITTAVTTAVTTIAHPRNYCFRLIRSEDWLLQLQMPPQTEVLVKNKTVRQIIIDKSNNDYERLRTRNR